MADSPHDYYGALGVRQDATPEEIKRAYRRLARELPPGRQPRPGRAGPVQGRHHAPTRCSPIRRSAASSTSAATRSPQGAGSAGNPFSGFGGFGDVFEAFFGGAGGGARPARVAAGCVPAPTRCCRCRLTLDEAAFGVRRELTVETAVVCETVPRLGLRAGHARRAPAPPAAARGELQSVQRSFLGQVMTTRACTACAGTGEQIPSPCPTCGTEGRVRARRTITVDVPAGIEDGMRIRLSGQGEVGPGGGPAGDLYVEIAEQPHDTFTREGSDLHCTHRTCR